MVTEASEISRALNGLFSSKAQGESGGFVIFEGRNELEYVQFSLDTFGLLLYWPVGGKKTMAEMERCRETLEELGLVEVAFTGENSKLTIESLQKNEFVVLDDGLFSNLGHDENFATTLTVKLFADVYNFFDLKNLKITLNA